MTEIKNVILAGAESVFGLEQIKLAFEQIGVAAEFAEAPFMLKYSAAEKNENIKYSDTLPENSVVVPLSEFWISYCIKTHQCRISEKALECSRSKKKLYDTFFSAGEDSVKYFSTVTEAESAVNSGKKIIIKPEGLYSGLGIVIIEKSNKEKFQAYIEQASAINTKNMKLMQIQNSGCMITEYISGTEYSADCFYKEGRISIVRLCRKKIIVINDKPCTAVCQIVKPDSVITEKLESWMNILFEKNNMSFAQFDFIITEDKKRIVPIDFACRVGGGMSELLKATGTNPYADAVKGCFNLCKNGKTLTQLNYLSVKNGYIKNDDYNLAEGKQFIYKHKGDYVISFPSSVGSRTAVVIQERDTDYLPVDIEKSLLIDEQWIDCNK